MYIRVLTDIEGLIKPRCVIKSEPAKELAEQMKMLYKEAQVALFKACDDMQHYTDFNWGIAPEYKVGNKVWLSSKNLNVDRPSHKLMEWQLGPFEVIKIVSSNAIKLKLPASFRIHDVINVLRVWPYKPHVVGQSSVPPELIDVEGNPEYEVEEILDSRLKHGKLEYLVKWSGYTDNYNTWEPKVNCANSPDIINDFYKGGPSALWKLGTNAFAGLIFKSYENFTESKKNDISHLEVEI